MPAPPVMPGFDKLAEAPAPEQPAEPEKTPAQVMGEVRDSAVQPVLSDAPAIPALPVIGASPYNVAPPPLTLAGAPNIPRPSGRALPVPAPTGLSVTAIPEPKPEKVKKAIPTWKETLKPSYTPMDTKFNFRRQVLPSVIYRDQYSVANRHLPTARSSQSYDHVFLLAVARNDVNAVRAMLANGRRNVNLVNAEGDTALIVALRHGAFETARLLLARGANPAKQGANGWSAFDYAHYWGDPVLLDAIYGRLS